MNLYNQLQMIVSTIKFISILQPINFIAFLYGNFLLYSDMFEVKTFSLVKKVSLNILQYIKKYQLKIILGDVCVIDKGGA